MTLPKRRKASHAPRLSGASLSSVVSMMAFEPFRRVLSGQIRKDLQIEGALKLDTSFRSPMPLDYRPVRAKPPRRLGGVLDLPSKPKPIPSSRTWTDRYASGQATPVEVVESALSSARAMADESPAMGCFTYLDDEGSMRDAKASAERWAAGNPLGPLDGVLQSEIDAADPKVGKACREALSEIERDGAELVDLSLELAAFASGIGFAVIGLETYAELAEQRRIGWRDLGTDTRLMMRFFETFAPGDYIEAECLRATLRQQCADLLRRVDVLALPTTASVAPKVTEREFRSGFSDVSALEAACRFTFMGNLTGLPCGQAPVGSGEDGLPVGLQIVGDAFDEGCVLAVLAHLERAGAAQARQPRVSANPLKFRQAS
ncbi:MAG: amidase family protein [Pseudomonadota bacterium]